MPLTDPLQRLTSSNVFASFFCFSLPFFDSPTVATAMKINSVTSFSWNTKILNVVFIPHLFTSKLEISAFSCLRCQLLTLNHWLGDPEGSWISSPKLSSRKKKIGKENLKFSFGKISPWTHLYYTKAVFYNNPRFNPSVRKEHNDLVLPMGARWRRGKAFHSRGTTTTAEMTFSMKKWWLNLGVFIENGAFLALGTHTNMWLCWKPSSYSRGEAFEGHSMIRLLLEGSFLRARSTRVNPNSEIQVLFEKAPSN